MNKAYNIFFDDTAIGVTCLEKADAPMGVVVGKIVFHGIAFPYQFLKEYCTKNKIMINADDPESGLIDTGFMSGVRVFNPEGIEIIGIGGNAICGINDEGYEISILGIAYPFYEEEFPHHVREYDKRFR